MEFVIKHQTEILLGLLALSEIIALTPLKSNSIFQLVVNTLKKFAPKKDDTLLK